MKKKILALLLCIMMIVSFGLAMTFGEEGAPTTPPNDSVHFDKQVKTDDNGNMFLQIDAWTEGVVSNVPTEIVFVVDQSGSMYQSANDKSDYMNPKEFLQTTPVDPSDPTKAERASIPGYYVALDKDQNVRLIRWNESKWEYSVQYAYADILNPFNELYLSVVFDRNNNEIEEWTELTATSINKINSNVKIYKSLFCGAVDAYYTLLEEVKNISNTKIAVVGFSTPKKYQTEHNSELISQKGGGIFFKTGTGNDVEFVNSEDLLNGSPAKGFYSALIPMSDSKSIENAIKGLRSWYGGTCTEEGFMMANEIFKASDEANPDRKEVKRVVVLFTDGAPTCISTDNSTYTGKDDINKGYAVAAAYETKNTYGATVYAYGNERMDKDDNDVFMERLSSNYPNANYDKVTNKYIGVSATDKNPAVTDDNNYMGFASNAAALEEAFKNIGTQIYEESNALNAESQIRDTVTPYFNIGGGFNGGNIIVQQIACTGVDSNGNATFDAEHPTVLYDATEEINKITFELKEDVEYEQILPDGTTETRKGDQVLVSGYDYGKNTVFKYAATPQGAKLRLLIPIEPSEEFLGGNHVPTNTEDSGIYPSDSEDVPPMVEFPVPETDVKPEATAEISADINVYLGSVFSNVMGTDGKLQPGLSVDDLHGVLKGRYNGEALDFTDTVNYGLDPGMSDYVNVELHIYQAVDARLGDDISAFVWEEEPVVSMTDIRWDTPYKLKLTITPKGTGKYSYAEAEAIGWIHVFYPEITFHDINTFYYGEEATSEEIKTTEEGANQANITVDWINKSREDEIIYDGSVTMTMPADGNIPEVTLSYSATLPEGMTELPNADVPVEVLVDGIGYLGKSALGLNPYVHFKWTSCDPACGQSITEHQGNARSPEFYIHPKSCMLTVQKTGGDDYESYVFDVYRNGEKHNEITVIGNGQTTIGELPVGTYTAVENNDWSWRYTPTMNPLDGVVLSRTNDEGTIVCTNKLLEKYWLDGSGWKQNIFGK